MSYLDDFTDFRWDVWKCGRCHKIVRLYDANDETERALMLQGHTAFNCATDPFLDVAVTFEETSR